MYHKTFVFFLGVLAVSLASAQKKLFKITDYGAVANSDLPNTRAIQKAIDVCSAAGGGMVLVPKNHTDTTKYLTGTIILKNNVELHIDSGVVLLGSVDYKDYQAIEPFIDGVGQSRGACLVGAINAKNIAITGKGTINGRGERWKTGNNPDYARRPFLLRLVKSEHCVVQDVYLTRSAAWMCNFDLCTDVHIEHITINNRVNANNDGIDIDACQKVLIKNCMISSTDDAICFKSTRGISPCQNVEIINNDIQSSCGGIKWGTESMGDFKNFTVTGNYIHDTNLGGIKILSADGANISGIRITDTRMRNVNVPVFIYIKSRLKTYHDQAKRMTGSIRDIQVEGLIATDCRTAGILITGIPGQYAGPLIRFKNVTLSGLGNNGTLRDSGLCPEENEGAYPEVNRFGTLPAWGIYIRHTRGVSFTNLNISKKQPDQRHALVFDDTDNTDEDLIKLTVPRDTGALPAVDRRHQYATAVKK
jgi:polygalacturonase